MNGINGSINMINILVQTKDPDSLRKKLTALAQDMGVDNFCQQAAREIVNRTQPERVIPDVYQPYRPLVRDGIQFFLAHLSLERLLDVIVCQFRMDMSSAAEERLLELAKQFPTLHKLGQIIARNRNLDPVVRKWLIHLENGKYGTAPDNLLAHINDRLMRKDGEHTVHIDPFILAEASVGAVIPFRWTAGDNPAAVHGVFKVLKPNIEANLEEELVIFRKMAHFFENNRQQYALNNFKFLDVFEDVREILNREVILENEQSNLQAASRFFENTDNIVIPDLIPLCQKTMTAMTYIDGEKITDADLTNVQRKACAHILMDALICRPLFATDEPALFHGDPHAGNILSTANGASGSVKVVLLDWSLAGWLTQAARVRIVRLMQDILSEDLRGICCSIQALADNRSEQDPLSRSKMMRVVSLLMQREEYARFSMMKRAFWLLEQLSYEGMVFPSELMLFRKAIFTLEGVLFDLDPQFDLDSFVFKYMAGLLADEFPWRFGTLFFHPFDKPENYRSLLSNADLQAIMTHQLAAAIRRHTNTVVDLFERQNQFMTQLFNWPCIKETAC